MQGWRNYSKDDTVTCRMTDRIDLYSHVPHRLEFIHASLVLYDRTRVVVVSF